MKQSRSLASAPEKQERESVAMGALFGGGGLDRQVNASTRLRRSRLDAPAAVE
jgi:hypothetical protein